MPTSNDKPNLCINYMYRDASNYKLDGYAVVRNPEGLTPEAFTEQLKAMLDEGTYFIAEEVDLEPAYYYGFSEDDHCWHELVDVATTAGGVTHDMTATELLERFREAAKKGWPLPEPRASQINALANV